MYQAVKRTRKAIVLLVKNLQFSDVLVVFYLRSLVTIELVILLTCLPDLLPIRGEIWYWSHLVKKTMNVTAELLTV